MQKKKFYSEAAYVVGLLLLALGAALMAKADFGLSMVVAPAYILHLKISQSISWFSFGVAEYTLQALLLVFIALIFRKIRPMLLFSLVTAVIYGNILDVMMALVSGIPENIMMIRAVCYVVGLLLSAAGIALLFHTYLAPEAYELLVKEISKTYHRDINRTKTAYDCVSCVVSVVMSFVFFGFGHFEGVKFGTILCALVNGRIIGAISHLLEQRYEFTDRLSLRRYFE